MSDDERKSAISTREMNKFPEHDGQFPRRSISLAMKTRYHFSSRISAAAALLNDEFP